MSFPIKALYLVLFLAATLGSYSCSTQQKSGGSDSATDAGGAESGADAVGSIPEDMLAEEKGPEAGAETANAETPEADPFKDLKEEESKAASEVAEGSASGGTGTMKQYTVQAGDTLMKIAFSLFGDVDRWKDLRDWNQDKLKQPSKLSKGMHLTYEEPSSPFQADQLAHSYEIKNGDTLAGIADEVYGRKAKYKKLQKYNSHLIKNPNRIFAGFTIFYDITEQEVAEAEARRRERGGEGEVAQSPPAEAAPAPSTEAPAPAAIPSAIAPAAEAAPPAPKPVATHSTAPAPASTGQSFGPPSPGAAQ